MTTLEAAPLLGSRASMDPTEGMPVDVEELSTPSDPVRSKRLKAFFHTMTLIGFLGLVTLVILGFTSGVLTSVASLRQFVEGFGILAPVAFILAGSLEAVFPFIPGSGTIISAPIIFGQFHGTIYAYLATALGSIIVFAIARILGRDLLVARFSTRTIERYGKWLDHPKFTKYFAIAIAAPLAPDDVLCYLAGLTKMRWRTYLLILLLCKPWGVLLYTTGVVTILKAVFPWLGL